MGDEKKYRKVIYTHLGNERLNVAMDLTGSG